MPTSYDPMQFARREVEHRQAMACRDCEEVIQQGIKAFEWIDHAEEALIRAEDDCLADYSPEAHQQIHQWYADWLAKAEKLPAIAADVVRAGFEVAHLAELERRLEIARDWLATQAAIVAATLPEEELVVGIATDP